jgi:hypothetical protein
MEVAMKIKTLMAVTILVFAAAPLNAGGNKKDNERGMLEKMEAVPCGAKEKGLSGLGSLWASAGITDVHSDEKLCPQYLVRTDDMDYHIRPTDGKHPVLLPIGHEIVFKIKKDCMFVKVPDGDHKTRSYHVVAEEPVNKDTAGAKPASDSPQNPE